MQTEQMRPVADVSTELQQISAIAAFVQNYAIATEEQYRQLADKLQEVLGFKKRLEEKRTSITKPINDSIKAINAMFAAPAAQLEDVERAIKRSLVAFNAERERLQREAQRKADEAARAEKERAEKAAREIREKAERDAQVLREKAAAEAEAGRMDAAAALEAKADNKVERAEAKAVVHEVAAATTVAPTYSMAPAKVTGLRFTDAWKFEVTNPALLPREYLMADERKIGAYIKAMKADAKVPGVRIWSEKIPASRSN